MKRIFLSLILALALSTPAWAALSDNLVAFWELEEASGTRADAHDDNDLSDTTSVTQATGKVGNAAQFTLSEQDHLLLADNADLSTGDIDFTWTLWVYMDSKTPATGLMYPLAKEQSDAASTEYMLRYESSGDRFVFITGGADYRPVTANNFGSPSTATWYFIVVWHDATGNTVNIQVNNGTADSAAAASGPSDTGTDFNIGSTDANSLRAWDGRIDQVGFWKRTLTTEEKTWLYNSGNGRSYAQVQAGISTPVNFFRRRIQQ